MILEYRFVKNCQFNCCETPYLTKKTSFNRKTTHCSSLSDSSQYYLYSLSFDDCGVLLFIICPAQNISLSQCSGASMAQQDPCWIDLQSPMNSTLYKLLRTSSANTVSVSVAEAKRCSCSLFHLVWSGKLKCIFSTINTREANEVQGPPTFFAHPSFSTATLHYKTTVHNSTKPVLEKVLGTPKVLHS